MAIYILGINSGLQGHDGAAALLKDGQLVVMAEQERFSRRKHAPMEPAVDAIKYCLSVAGIGLDDVSVVAHGWEDHTIIDPYNRPFDEDTFLATLFPREVFAYNRRPTIQYVPHHVAHAASTFFASGLDEAAILVVDGRGEFHSTTLAYGKGDTIEILKQYDIDQSLGIFYGAAAAWAGLTIWDAGKLMGLASYGRPNQPMPIAITDDGYLFTDIADSPKKTRRYLDYRYVYFQSFFRKHVFPYERGTGTEIMAYANLAASVQLITEAAVCRLAQTLKQITGSDHLVLAGGVALNCIMNARLARESGFTRLFVQPIAYDAGVSLGAALYAWRAMPEAAHYAPFVMPHVYWGPSFDEPAIQHAFAASGLTYQIMEEDALVDYVAARLERHEIVGWFQGRAEIGPRALGARSILGNPLKRENLTKINHLKGREIWRPLAPSILKEEFATFFDAPIPSEYMIIAADVRPHVRRRIPAIVHVDGSTRPHAVSKAVNARYWKLIKRFGDKTGVPLVINTSFNLAGEPIVNTPVEAINDFVASPMDVLVIGNCVASKH